MTDDDTDRPPAEQVLDVYASHDGAGGIPTTATSRSPMGGSCCRPGTSTVKQLGVHWLAWQPQPRNRRHRRTIGVWAPADNIAQAQQMAEGTPERWPPSVDVPPSNVKPKRPNARTSWQTVGTR